MRRALGIERIEANREKVLAWAAAGRPYFWIARQIGLGERNASAVSHWLVKQGIRRKVYPFDGRAVKSGEAVEVVRKALEAE